MTLRAYIEAEIIRLQGIQPVNGEHATILEDKIAELVRQLELLAPMSL